MNYSSLFTSPVCIAALQLYLIPFCVRMYGADRVLNCIRLLSVLAHACVQPCEPSTPMALVSCIGCPQGCTGVVQELTLALPIVQHLCNPSETPET